MKWVMGNTCLPPLWLVPYCFILLKFRHSFKKVNNKQRGNDKLTIWEIQRAGIDAHELKKEFPDKNAKIKRLLLQHSRRFCESCRCCLIRMVRFIRIFESD